MWNMCVCHSIVFIQFSIIPISKRKQIEFADPCEFVHKYFNPSSVIYSTLVPLSYGLSKHCACACGSNVIGSMTMFTFGHAVIWVLFAIVIVGFPFFHHFLLFKSHKWRIYTIRSGLFSVYIDIWWTSVCFLRNSSIGYNRLSTFRLK